jgi:diaminohydroxyphosphoribosylaminopyrimidine deaminase/5-amino-6-(5-phosphoribosylamino)uracil reductase
MNIHEKYIKRCIEIAKNGLGTTRPNPMVGSVIVYNDAIIGEGFTSKYGSNHAEVNAIKSVLDKSLLKKATLYVTLEPCSHFGKTPPCSDLIIKSQIPNVVIGCIDDNEQVAGKGIKKLKEAGCNVTVGVLENACKNHHKRFFTFHNKKRPYIILKWAETQDGFIAPETKNEQKPVWISNIYSRQLVHKWRAEEQAILIGTNTVIEDNPSLTVRDWKGENPIRVVLDKKGILSKDFNVFNEQAKTTIIKETSAKAICEKLFESDINSIIIEGGAKTLQIFINENLWDEARVFTGDVSFIKGIKSPKFSGILISEEKIDSDILKTYTNS